MIVKKITVGFVIQEYDTEEESWISQEFVASDECDYEDEEGNPIDPFDVWAGLEPYLPFDMDQP